MKKHEIKVGGHYVAKVAGRLTTVRVDAIREVDGYTNPSAWASAPTKTLYDVTNLTTNRKTTFRSAANAHLPRSRPEREGPQTRSGLRAFARPSVPQKVKLQHRCQWSAR